MTQPDQWRSPYDPPQEPNAQVPAPYEPYQQGQQPFRHGPYAPQPPPAQGPQYQHAAPYGYAPRPEKNDLGVWSLVLGILSVVMLFSCGVGFLAAIPAVITGHLSRKAQKEGLANNEGLALGGIITGWVTIGLTVLVAVGIGVLFSIPEFREGFFSESSSSY